MVLDGRTSKGDSSLRLDDGINEEKKDAGLKPCTTKANRRMPGFARCARTRKMRGIARPYNRVSF